MGQDSRKYFGESHALLRDTARKLIARHVTPFIDEWERNEAFPRELYRTVGEAGFLGLGIPEELGGTPGDTFHHVAMIEEFATA